MIALVTDMYSTLKPLTPMLMESMRSLVPSLHDPAQMQDFDRRFGEEKSTTGQRRLMKEALKNITGVAQGQWFRKMDTSSQTALLRSMPDKMAVRARSHEMIASLDESFDQRQDELGLAGLFQP